MHAVAQMDDAAQPAPQSTSPEGDWSAGPSLPMLWDALEAAQWSLRAQQRLLPEVLAHAQTLAPSSRIAWLIRLREASHHAWAAPICIRETLIRLAWSWSDWPLLLAICERMESAEELPEWADALMATAQLRLGAAQTALVRARMLALLHPQDRWAAEMHDAPAEPTSPVIESTATIEKVSCATAIFTKKRAEQSMIFFMALIF